MREIYLWQEEYQSLEAACQRSHNEFVLELMAQSTGYVTTNAVESAPRNEELAVKLACMHVDVVRALLFKLNSILTIKFCE